MPKPKLLQSLRSTSTPYLGYLVDAMREIAALRLLLTLATLVTIAPAVSAENTTESERALELGHEGLALYETGHWGQAFARFEQANALTFSPVFVLYMARCQRNGGRLKEAAQLLNELVRRTMPDASPVSWANAWRDARAEHEAIRRSIPSLRISSRGIVAATVDGRSVPLDEPVELNPGEYIVRGWSSTGSLALERVVLTEAQKDLVVTLSFPAEHQAVTPPSPASKPPVEARRSEPSSHRTAVWMSGGAALVAAVFGSVMGVMARSQRDAVLAHCDGTRCPTDQIDEADRATLFANLSTVGFVTAGVNLAAAFTFFALPAGVKPHEEYSR